MKANFLKFTLFVYVLVVVVACSGKKEAEHDHEHEHEQEAAASDDTDWKEMDSFHMIMAETFHPYKDSSNLEPIKVHAEHLAMEADKWLGAALPEKVNNEEVKANLEKLKSDTRALADLIKGGATDEQIGTALTGVHDQFHKLQEAWYGGGHDDHHKEEQK